MPEYRASTVFMLAPQRHGSNKTQSLLSTNNPDLHGPYPPVPRREFMALEGLVGPELVDAMTLSANLSPRPLVPGGRLLSTAEVERERRERELPQDVLGISLAINLVGARLAGQGRARILCKSPDNLDIAERFGDRLADAAFVHVIRDPRAVWNSGRGTARGPQSPHASALKWADYHLRVAELAKSTPLVTLKYEDLMVRPADELRRACEFLEVPFTAEMLKDHGADELKHAAALNPELWGNAWERELPSEEIEIVDNTCRAIMEAYGYEPRHPARPLTAADRSYRPELPPPAEGAEPRRAQLTHCKHLAQCLEDRASTTESAL
jgi:hypothetical protein